MNTPAHLIVGAAAFGRPEHRWTIAAALLGAMIPDLSLYLLVGWHLLILETEARVVFDELYFSDAWQSVFAVDNSVLVWGAVLALGIWQGWRPVVAMGGAALLHIALDFPLHAGDGRPHFWPLTDWVFHSPISYWDSRAGARILGPIEALLATVLVVVLWRRVKAIGWRILFVGLLLAEMGSSNIWRFVF